jgi:hypothetical protein
MTTPTSRPREEARPHDRLPRATPRLLQGETEKEKKERWREQCAELLLARARAQTSAARTALLESSAREAEARCSSLAQGIDLALSFASGYGVFDPIPDLDRASFVLGETTRGAALESAALMRHASDAPRSGELRTNLRREGEELAALAQKGRQVKSSKRRCASRATQRELVELARGSGGTAAALKLTLMPSRSVREG